MSGRPDTGTCRQRHFGDILFSQAAAAQRQPVFARLELRVVNAAAVLDAAAARGYPLRDGAIALCGVDIAVS